MHLWVDLVEEKVALFVLLFFLLYTQVACLLELF